MISANQRVWKTLVSTSTTLAESLIQAGLALRPCVGEIEGVSSWEVNVSPISINFGQKMRYLDFPGGGSLREQYLSRLLPMTSGSLQRSRISLNTEYALRPKMRAQ